MKLTPDTILLPNRETGEILCTKPIQYLLVLGQQQTSPAGAAAPLTDDLRINVTVRPKGASIDLAESASLWQTSRIDAYLRRQPVFADVLQDLPTNTSAGRFAYVVQVGALGRNLYLDENIKLVVTLSNSSATNQYAFAVYGIEAPYTGIVPIRYESQFEGAANVAGTQPVPQNFELDGATHVFVRSLAAAQPDWNDLQIFAPENRGMVSILELNDFPANAVMKMREPSPLVMDFTGTSVALRNAAVSPFFTANAGLVLPEAFRGTVMDVTDFVAWRSRFPAQLGSTLLVRRQMLSAYTDPNGGIRRSVPAAFLTA